MQRCQMGGIDAFTRTIVGVELALARYRVACDGEIVGVMASRLHIIRITRSGRDGKAGPRCEAELYRQQGGKMVDARDRWREAWKIHSSIDFDFSSALARLRQLWFQKALGLLRVSGQSPDQETSEVRMLFMR